MGKGETWKSEKLGDVLQVIRGVSFPKDAKRDKYSDNLVACLRTANVQREVEWDDLWFVEEKYVSREELKRFWNESEQKEK